MLIGYLQMCNQHCTTVLIVFLYYDITEHNCTSVAIVCKYIFMSVFWMLLGEKGK